MARRFYSKRATQFEVGEDHMLCCGMVPGLARRRLIVPNVGAVVRIKRDYRRQEEVVAFAVATMSVIPGRSIARADIQ